MIPEVAVAMPLWMDHYLKGGSTLPETPQSELRLKPNDDAPILRVTPDAKTLPVARVEIYYSVDPDPRARFWRSAEVTHEGDSFIARLPLHTLDMPLFAFANVYHTLPKPVSLAALPGNPKSVTEVCISSLLHSHSPAEVKQANPKLTAKPSTLIDDFAHGLRDWYPINAGNPTHQQTWTRKVTDPLYRGPDGAKLKLTLNMPQTNKLTVVLQQNEWRNYRGSKATFTCEREIPGSDTPQTITLDVSDFISKTDSLKSWSQLDQLGLCAHFAERGAPAKTPPTWKGPAPQFLRLEWQ